MDPISIIMIAGAVAQIAGPLVGKFFGDMDKDQALELIKRSADRFGKISVPKLQQLVLQSIPPTELDKVKEDPRYRGMVEDQAAALENIAKSGGLTLSDRAALEQVRNRLDRGVTANRQGLEQQMAARGTLDSGAQIALDLGAQQQASQAASEQGAQTAGQAQQRAYDAILNRGQLGQQMSNTDYARKANRAQAQDAINRGNADISNLAARYNVGLPQQDFQNQLSLATAQSGPDMAYAQWLYNRGQSTQDFGAQLGKAAGQVAGAFGQPSPIGSNGSGLTSAGAGLSAGSQPMMSQPAVSGQAPGESYDAWLKRKASGG